MYRLPLFSLVLLMLFPARAHTQIPYALIYDRYQSESFGAENIISLQHLVSSGTDKLIPGKLWEENSLLRKGAGIGFRLLKCSLLDFQIDFLFALTQHEVFGHGSRMRENGYTNIRYGMSLFFPFGKGGGSAEGDFPVGHIPAASEALMVTLSGNEANLLLSDNLEARMIFDDGIHYRQGLLYLISRNNLTHYAALTYLAGNSGDIRAYIQRVNSGLGRTVYTEKKIFLQSLFGLADPMQLFTAWAVGKDYILDGEHVMQGIPALHIGRNRYIPAFQYNLSPFGSEFILNQYLVRDNRMFRLNLRWGDPSAGRFYGLGLRAYNLLDRQKIWLNGGLNIWYQPEFELGGEALNTIPEGPGIMAEVSASVFPFAQAEHFGLFGQAGYKTSGYVPGERLQNGFILRFGLALRP